MSVQHSPKHTLPRLIGRAISGRPMNGVRRTDSTFLQRATRDLTPHGRAGRWHHLPGWQRAAWRAGLTVATLGSLYGQAVNRPATVAGLITAAVISLVIVVILAHRKIRVWAHTRRVVIPLFQTVAMIVGHPPNDDHRKYIAVPRNYATHEKALVTLKLPPTWEAAVTEQKRITALVQRRLGPQDWEARWHHHASPPRVEFFPAPAPPARVMFEDFREYMDKSGASVLPLGFGTGNAVAGINLDSESPHIALSMGTGGGKSDTIALIIAYLVKKRCERIDIIDPKRVSHSWARGLPGVYIHKYVAAQMEAIRDARALMDSRYDELDINETADFSRHVLIIEEQNSLMTELAEYWAMYRSGLEPAERAKAPRTNPAINDLRYILNKGRQCRINVISVYQRMSAQAAGGGDARENYGAKILARYSPQTWKILVGTSPVPRPSRVPGRAMFVLGDECHAIQRAYAGIADKSGKPDPAGIARLRAYALDGRPDTREPGPGLAWQPAEPPEAPSELVTLREACDSNVIPIKYAAARKARQRAMASGRSFPAGQPGSAGTLYRAADLRAWYVPDTRAA